MNHAEQALAASISQPRAVIYVVRGRPGQDDRPSLPSGHPITWGAITEGSVIDGAQYPHPVWLD